MMQNMEQKLADCRKSLAEEKGHSDVIVEFYKDVMHSEEYGAQALTLPQLECSLRG